MELRDQAKMKSEYDEYDDQSKRIQLWMDREMIEQLTYWWHTFCYFEWKNSMDEMCICWLR